MSESEGEAVKGTHAVADLIFNVKDAKKLETDATYEKNSLRAPL